MSSDAPGRVVVFLGPDGAGKSTVLELVQARLEARGTDFTYRHFAPGFLKRYRPKGSGKVNINHRHDAQYGTVLKFVKLSLMLFEFRIGLLRLRQKHGILLFDRYIHDVLVDPRRYRMECLRWWMVWMLKAAPNPDLLIILSAPADVIQARKQEVGPDETARQLAAYEALAGILPNTFIVGNDTRPDAAAKVVLSLLDGLL